MQIPEENVLPMLSDIAIFTRIWTSPRKILRYIHDNRYDKYTAILIVLAGSYDMLGNAMRNNMGDSVSIWGILGFNIFLGGILGALLIYIYAALLSWTGKLLKGQGDTISLLRIIAYGLIPYIINVLFLVLQMSIYGIDLFKSDGEIYTGSTYSGMIFYTSFILGLILRIFTIIFCIIGISEVQKISVFLAIVNIFLSTIVLFIPMVIFIRYFT